MNEEQLQEFKLKHGISSRKNGEAAKSSDLVSVRTPNPDQQDSIDLVRPDGTIR